MTLASLQCASDDELHALAAGDISETAQVRLTAHLDDCPSCRERLAALVGWAVPTNPVGWDQRVQRAPAHRSPSLGEGLPTPPRAPALAHLIDQIKSEPPTTPFDYGSTDGGDSPAPLDFLSPPNDPSHLGRLGRYLVQAEIGRGASGIVLRALDEQLSRVVALKVLSPRLATNEHARRRFVREARAAAAIRDDHVIGIHHVEEIDGLPFLVMEYIVGRSLGQRLQADGPLPVADILRIGAQIARGLAAAHAQGLVHRDIKPANILLENGVERVKITDFGLAHAVDDVRTTQPGTVVGTPEYMSPEQARGERVDHRSDLFSLGCVLYAMCAGRPPFRAESTVAVIKRVCEDTPRPLAEINPDIPQWLAGIIDRLIAKDSADRFQSAAEVAELLEQCLAEVQQHGLAAALKSLSLWERVAAKPPGEGVLTSDLRSLTSVRRQSKIQNLKSKIAWPTTAAILLLTAALVAAESTGVTSVAATVIRIVRGDGTLVVEVDDPSIQVLLDGDEIAITGAGPKELRLLPGQHQLQSVKDGKPVETKLVTITKGGRDVVKVTRELTAPPQRSSTARLVWENAAYSARPSLDGRYLVFTTATRIKVRDLLTGENSFLIERGKDWEHPADARISPDGKFVAYRWLLPDEKAELRIVPFDGGASRTLFADREHWTFPYPYGWTSDGQSLVVGLLRTHDKSRLDIVRIDTANGNMRNVASLDASNIRSWQVEYPLSPDGRYLAVTRQTVRASNRDIYLIDVDTGNETQITRHEGDEDVFEWAPDGKRLLITIGRDTSKDLWAVRIKDGKPQGEPQFVRANVESLVPLGITRDGVLYYTQSVGGQTLFVGELDVTKGTANLAPLEAEQFSVRENFVAPTWSADGERLAYKAQGGSSPPHIRIYSAKTRQVQPVPIELNFLSTFRWSRDDASFLSASQKEPGRVGVYQIDAVTGGLTTLVEPSDDNIPAGAARWSPDAKGFFYEKTMGAIVYHDLATRAEREILSPDKRLFTFHRFDVSPNGRLIAAHGQEPDSLATVMHLINVTDGSSRELLRFEKQMQQGWFTNLWAGWAPDSQSIFFIRYDSDNEKRGLWSMPATGGEPRQYQVNGVDASRLLHFSIHPGGKTIAAAVSSKQKTDIWALENFLPPLESPKPSQTSP